MTLADSYKKHSIGDTATLADAPEELTRNLPSEDAVAINRAIGEPMRVMGYDAHGQVELEFTDEQKIIHTIWVKPSYVKKYQLT